MTNPPGDTPERRPGPEPDGDPEGYGPADFDDLSGPTPRDYPPIEEETHIIGTSAVPPDRTPPQIDPAELAGLYGDEGLPGGARRVLPLEDEASHLVARYLFPTERYRGEWKRHFIYLTVPMLVAAGATVLLGWLSGFTALQGSLGAMTTIAVLIWAGVMGWVAWQVAEWHFNRFILTNKRVMVVSGIVTRKVAMMPLLRVTDMKYEQSPLARVLNYGTFVLESAGQDQALREVKHLPNPNELYLRVVEEMYEPAAVEARLGRATEPEDEEQRPGDA
jgi:membrane protein YdbS with pleckstrin-like domain